MRTPEETVRLANGVTVETPHGPVGASCLVMGNAYPHPSAMPDRAVTVSEHLAYALADLAEARAEVARQEAEIADLQRYIREDEERGDGRLDCGSNNCLTATGPLTGMRTNGGCSCGNRALRLAIQKARAEVAALREDRDRFAMLRCCEMAGAMVTAIGINPPGEDAVANWRAVCDAAEQMAAAARLVREWQAAKRASTYTPNAGFTQSWLDLKIANDEREDIESRLLAAILPEVRRG